MSVVSWVFVGGAGIFLFLFVAYKAISILGAPRNDRGADWKGRRNSSVAWRVRRH